MTWAAGVLVPYFVNDLQHVPLSQVASGAHDPKDLWPYASGGVAVGLLRLASFLAMGAGSIVSIVSAVGAAAVLVRTRGSSTAGQRALLASIAVLSSAFSAALLSPFGQALSTWALDRAAVIVLAAPPRHPDRRVAARGAAGAPPGGSDSM